MLFGESSLELMFYIFRSVRNMHLFHVFEGNACQEESSLYLRLFLLMHKDLYASIAIYSSMIADSTESSGLFPHVNGP